MHFSTLSIVQYYILVTILFKVRHVGSSYKHTLEDEEFKLQRASNEQQSDLSSGLRVVSEDEARLRLAFLFDHIDANKDGYVQLDELVKQLRKSQRKYIDEDVKRHWLDFKRPLDDGSTLSWQEYADIEFQHLIKFKENSLSNKKKKELEEYLQRQSAKDRKRWAAADIDTDGKLNLEEFTFFSHPEQFEIMRSIVLEEEFEKFDKDSDKLLTIQEFATELTIKEDTHRDSKQKSDWIENEKQKFSTVFDKNKDEKLDITEFADWLSKYQLIDHTVAEAQHLMRQADTNKDHKLTKEEVLASYNAFVDSHITDFGEALNNQLFIHDEL